MPANASAKSKRATQKRTHVQWSKIANAVSDALIVILYLLARGAIGDDAECQLKALQGALEALAFVQALYSGNSVSEKFFVSKYHLFQQNTGSDTDAAG